MPIANVRGVNLNYEVLGTGGPWIALSPGGRRALDNVKPLAQRLADAGYRVLIHDRRNCGISDIVIGADASEYEVWADDLYVLLAQLKAQPAVIGGSSSGCRLSMLFALKYPHAVRALLLWRVTGGAFAAQRLTENYYDKYIRAAQQGGMAAVCALDHFKERIEARPSNRADLMAMAPQAFIAAMERWREQFAKGAELPVIGASETGPQRHQSPDLHHPRQRQDPQSRGCRGRPPHDPRQRAARSLSRRPRRRSRPGRGLGAERRRDGAHLRRLSRAPTGQGSLSRRIAASAAAAAGVFAPPGDVRP